jgi:CheY-like chemotaxis protein
MSPVTPGGVSRRILVADDDPDGAETLAVMLRSSGHEVRVADDGPATLEVANDFRPQVVFLDLGMPGMDGYQIARRLRQMDGLDTSLLVALTGYGREVDRQRAYDAGFDVFLVKPASPKILCEIAMQSRH